MIYKCNSCDYVSKKWFGICPRCKSGEGIEMDEKVNQNFNPNLNKSLNDSLGNIENYTIKKINNEYKRDKIVRNTKYKNFDRVLSGSGGFVEDQVIVLSAAPGVGKSTLCAEIASDDTIYISTEESDSQVNNRFLRVNPDCGADIVSVTNIGSIIDIINKTECKLIILDSLNNINNGTDSYVRQAQNMGIITNALKKNKKIGIIICQVAKNGELLGMNSIAHICDTTITLERSMISSNLILSSTKNRFGEIGSIAIFEHCDHGLIEISDDSENGEDEIGCTYVKTKFGYKSINVCIEALVAQSSMNYGQKKVNGVNINRVQQIIGILNYNSNINFMDKDIYVSVSNGLKIDDTMTDVAIANSILSSYYNKINKLKHTKGEISLNGKIKGNKVLNHIKDLINLYK